MGKWMVSSVDSHTNFTSSRLHLREIDLRFALNTTPGGWEKGVCGTDQTAGWSLDMAASFVRTRHLLTEWRGGGLSLCSNLAGMAADTGDRQEHATCSLRVVQGARPVNQVI